MSNVERFKDILTQIPFERSDLSVVNKKDYLPLFEELTEIYNDSNVLERSLITQFVQSDINLSYRLVHWVHPFEESDPKRFLKYRLITFAIREGIPDFRDDLLALVGLWDFAEEKD